jgi:hypothetical protein
MISATGMMRSQRWDLTEFTMRVVIRKTRRHSMINFWQGRRMSNQVSGGLLKLSCGTARARQRASEVTRKIISH